MYEYFRIDVKTVWQTIENGDFDLLLEIVVEEIQALEDRGNHFVHRWISKFSHVLANRCPNAAPSIKERRRSVQAAVPTAQC
ncbi:hypothetical protein [Roseibium aggregatum]|uniref:hypothetical protein n=1 Tax=Roseibium aggregatum TaxID=187304 RepID=UPI002B4B9F82|nr:hypothetical protein [Roseibium aggregatum]